MEFQIPSQTKEDFKSAIRKAGDSSLVSTQKYIKVSPKSTSQTKKTNKKVKNPFGNNII